MHPLVDPSLSLFLYLCMILAMMPSAGSRMNLGAFSEFCNVIQEACRIFVEAMPFKVRWRFVVLEIFMFLGYFTVAIYFGLLQTVLALCFLVMVAIFLLWDHGWLIKHKDDNNDHLGVGA